MSAKNSPQTWDGLVAKHGETVAFAGNGMTAYFETGDANWSDLILPRLQPLGDRPRALEWGAGSGRVTQAAVRDLSEVGAYWAYEPSEAARELWHENLPEDTLAVLIDTPQHVLPEAKFTHIFCWYTCHHFTYDDWWEFLGFVEQHLAPGGTLLFDYIPTTTLTGQEFLARKDSSEWPLYLWHPEQIAALIAFRAPSLRHVETVDLKRELQVWRREP